MRSRLSVLFAAVCLLVTTQVFAQDPQGPVTHFGEALEPAATNVKPIRAFAGAGLGIQYGFLGGQVGLQWKRLRLRSAVGFGGISAGIDLVPTRKFSLGVQTFRSYFLRGNGVNFNYYFEDARQGGWSVGLDLTQISTLSSSDDTESDGLEPSFFALVSVGFIR